MILDFMFPWIILAPPIAITKLLYRSKLVYFWWKATLPFEFQIWTFFVNSCLDGLWKRRCYRWNRTQLDDKTVITMTSLEGTSYISHKDHIHWIQCQCPIFIPVTQQRSFQFIEAVWDLYLQLLMVTCTSIAGNGLCH